MNDLAACGMAELAQRGLGGARAPGGASVGRGAGAAEPCAMRSVPASVPPPLPATARRVGALVAVAPTWPTSGPSAVLARGATGSF